MGASGVKKQRALLLKSIVELMIWAGDSEGMIKNSVDKILVATRRIREKKSRYLGDAAYSPKGDVSADLLRLWHRDDRYLNDSEGAPRPLPLFRGKNSVRAMVRSINPTVDADAVVHFMLSAGLIRKCAGGRYLPVEEAGAILRDAPFVIEHLTRSVVRLISTVKRNAGAGHASQSLVERYAYVSDLSPSECKAFAEFTKAQGLNYLQAVDDWMEQRRVGRVPRSSRSRSAGVVAGVQVVAYLGEGHESVGRVAGRARRKKVNEEGADSRQVDALN